MEEHYYEAGIRHFIDGSILMQKECFDNAVCLYGNSAECALKCLMAVFCGETGRFILQHGYGHKGLILKNDLYGFVTNSSITPLLDPILGLKLQDFEVPECLFQDHPERRYDKNGRFNQHDAESCEGAARFLMNELIRQHIDGYI